jgi:superfamily II DNA or RNA helicase
MLFPEQHGDVQGAEQRFTKPDGHGMLFTNGTGTGKTYSGLGVIKRFAMQGKRNTLVVVPSQGILLDWMRGAKSLGLQLNILSSAADKGRAFSGTTYANFGANRHIADRNWDLVVADEAHKLSSDQNGTVTEALRTLRALTLHPEGLYDRAKMVLRNLWDRIERIPENERQSAYVEFEKKAQALIDKWKKQERPKALMMSATPFPYHFSLDYAEGYLFNFDRGETN